MAFALASKYSSCQGLHLNSFAGCKVYGKLLSWLMVVGGGGEGEEVQVDFMCNNKLRTEKHRNEVRI